MLLGPQGPLQLTFRWKGGRSSRRTAWLAAWKAGAGDLLERSGLRWGSWVRMAAGPGGLTPFSSGERRLPLRCPPPEPLHVSAAAPRSALPAWERIEGQDLPGGVLEAAESSPRRRAAYS
jgi:hypothetical protein